MRTLDQQVQDCRETWGGDPRLLNDPEFESIVAAALLEHEMTPLEVWFAGTEKPESGTQRDSGG